MKRTCVLGWIFPLALAACGAEEVDVDTTTHGQVTEHDPACPPTPDPGAPVCARLRYGWGCYGRIQLNDPLSDIALGFCYQAGLRTLPPSTNPGCGNDCITTYGPRPVELATGGTVRACYSDAGYLLSVTEYP